MQTVAMGPTANTSQSRDVASGITCGLEAISEVHQHSEYY
jgi:hypothetical protein